MEGFRFSTESRCASPRPTRRAIAHNAAYLVWYEVARIEYLARFRGGYKSLRADGYEALTIESHVRYLKPVFFDDRITINARCVDVRGARFRYEYVLERDGRGRRGRLDAHAVVDRETLRPTRLPAWLAEAIAAAEAARRRVGAGRPARRGGSSGASSGFGFGFGFGFVPTRTIFFSPR